MKLVKYLFFILFLLSSAKVNAECDFKTGEFIDQLSDSKSIKSLVINIPKSKRYARNQLKILTSASKNIPPSLRKKYKADILVKYTFGNCKYEGKIWQNGDYRDHIYYDAGKIISSLNVELNNGNIANSVKFKLLIPETRLNLNEILGTVILKEHNFIVPETFEVKTIVNNAPSLMIFQEDSQKELLERNFRREGPIFEGDETLIFQDDENLAEITAPSLTRLINYRSSLKGLNTLDNYLDAYLQIQSRYLNNQEIFVDPNFDSDFYRDYAFLILSMNGAHALYKFNQKHYFNLITKKFEPIYYDGNFELRKDINKIDFIPIYDFKNYSINFTRDYIYPYINFLKNKKVIKELETNFASKLIYYDEVRKEFFYDSINQIIENQDSLNLKIKSLKSSKENNILEINNNFFNDRVKFIDNNKNFSRNLFFIDYYKIINEKVYFKDNYKNYNLVSLKEFGRILSRKKFKNKSFIFLPNKKIEFKSKTFLKYSIPSIGAEISYHPSVKPYIDIAKKLIIFENVPNKMPVIISGGNLKNWSIKYNSEEFINTQNKNRNSKKERTNFYGYTGCLNFINSNFNMTDINVINSRCEDSINIINSRGLINNLNVKNAYQDGLDIDFSNLKILNSIIEGAGNDCIDFSGGIYFLQNVKTYKCADKSISVGEKSTLDIETLNSEKSNVALAVKDSSIVNVGNANIFDSEFCLAAYKKKQEFGGAFIEVKKIECEGEFFSDKNSSIAF